MSEIAIQERQPPPQPTRRARDRSSFPQYLLAASAVIGTTLVVFFLVQLIGYRAVALIYLLVVVIMALFIGPGPTLLAATLSALSWDFFFLAPVTNLRISNVEDTILFGMYFVVALVLGQLTARIRAQERQEREREQLSTALYLLTRELVEAAGLDNLLSNVVRHLQSVLDAHIAIILPNPASPLGFQVHPASNYDITGPEQPLVAELFERGRLTGKSAEQIKEPHTLFVPLTSGERVLGVMGLNFDETSPSSQQRHLLQAFSQPIALALDRQRLREESRKSELLAESERLSKNLLNSVSHEIRTPLAVIRTAASTLGEIEEPRLSELQQGMIVEIQEATQRLDTLVGKVLDISRLESGTVKPRLKLCEIEDLLRVAVRETRKQLSRHRLEVDIPPGLPLVEVDYILVQEAVKNLLSNAAAHTPPGTLVELKGRVRGTDLILSVGDRGPGIAPAHLARIFDKFYRGPGAPTGGTGLGLSVVKGFVEACRGQVRAENRVDGGALFTIRLPITQTAQGPAPDPP